MLEVLQYILNDFWRFIGFAIILSMILKGLIALVAIVLNRNVDIS